MNNIANALLEAIDSSPCSERALAHEAGIDHSLLVRIRQGTRGATPEVAGKVAAALEGWGDRCHSAARSLREELDRHQEGEPT